MAERQTQYVSIRRVGNRGAEVTKDAMIKKRKISGSTRSEAGRKCRDTFASLKKTCRKQGISFWDFLTDRTGKTKQIPLMADIIQAAACG